MCLTENEHKKRQKVQKEKVEIGENRELIGSKIMENNGKSASLNISQAEKSSSTNTKQKLSMPENTQTKYPNARNYLKSMCTVSKCWHVPDALHPCLCRRAVAPLQNGMKQSKVTVLADEAWHN